jgi:hypothetical protein
VGQPSETLLPPATRHVLRQFLQDNGIAAPKVFLLMRHLPGGGVSQDLVFNITPEAFASEAHYRSVMGHLGWFLPRHYSFVGMEEATVGDSFRPL